MRRKLFATAVVLLVLATPLFAGQTATAAQPASGSAKQPATAAAQDKQQPAVPKPTASTATPKAVPVAAKPADGAAAVKAAPTAAKPSATTAKAPAAPKGPTVRLITPAATAKPYPNPTKAVPAHAAASPIPLPAVKAAPASLSPVQQKVHGSKSLSTELQAKLAGADVVAAAEGFKDLQQFVSAVHASHNLGLGFDTLKAKLLSGKRTSLRQAIQELNPKVSAAIESQRAQYDADGSIKAAQVAEAKAASEAQPKPKPAAAPKSKASSQTQQ